MAFSLQAIKNEIAKTGTNKGKFLFFKDGTKVRVRFLNDMEEGMEIPFHDSFKLGVNVPCQEMFGRECSYCEDEDLRTRNMYVWSVYDYESKEVKLFMFAVNNCSPIPTLVSLYESYGTITDRDYEIKRIGKGQNTTYSVIPLDKKKFRNEKVKPLSEQAVMKAIDKAYPADNSDIEEEPKTKSKKTKEDDDAEYEDMSAKELYELCKEKGIECKSYKSENYYIKLLTEYDNKNDELEQIDYEELPAKELYKMCIEKNIECKPRKAKEYYIDLLEEYDEESEDDWGDEEEDEYWD